MFRWKIQLFAGLRIRITLMRIRFQRFNSMQILILIKALKTCDHWLQNLQGFVLSLHTSIVSVHGPLRFHSELLKLLNFDFNADPDPTFHLFIQMRTRIQLPKTMRIWIRNPGYVLTFPPCVLNPGNSSQNQIAVLCFFLPMKIPS
jgi:hypothetical protein